jgi:transcriptional regulator with XRE-family HTH domain/Zn-dependent peptidase ImmA (M78 family)
VIKNERQYRITKAQAERFADALKRAESASNEEIHPLLRKAQLDALRSQLADLTSEVAAYESLVANDSCVVEVESFDELPLALIRARVASGLSQRDLAERLGMKEQQIQRYEGTNYSGASFARLAEIVKALGISMREDILVPSDSLSIHTFLSRLESLGLSKDFVERRLLPGDAALEERTNIGELVFRVASSLRRIFGWSLAEVLGPAQPSMNFAIAGAARFKLPARVAERKLSAYTIYAHHLSWLSIQGTPQMETQLIPRDPGQVIGAIRDRYGELTFRTALEYVWSLGVIVLPLDDSGSFHGACWRIGGRNVIVLKQKTRSEARWLFDLLHELWHAGEEPDLDERTILELPEADPERRTASEEKKASRFAGEVILEGRAEELVAMIIQMTGGEIPQFKAALLRIAKRENVSVDSLANYLAFRLSLQQENWWGTANNLQTIAQPWTIARDLFVMKCDLSQLNLVDQGLLTRALEESDEVAA